MSETTLAPVTLLSIQTVFIGKEKDSAPCRTKLLNWLSRAINHRHIIVPQPALRSGRNTMRQAIQGLVVERCLEIIAEEPQPHCIILGGASTGGAA